jgi:hypothetical protein
MRLIPKDTTQEAAAVQNEILRKIGIEGRARMTFEMSDNLRRIVQDGVKLRHPDWDDEAVRLEAIRLTLGDRLFEEAFGNAEESG